MRIPLIKVRDGQREHLVGTNRHDVLYIKNGGLYYLNAQCMAGTEGPENDGMEFVAEPCSNNGETVSSYPEVEFVDVEEFLDLIIKELNEEADNEEEFQRLMEKVDEVFAAKEKHDGRLEKLRSSAGYLRHS